MAKNALDMFRSSSEAKQSAKALDEAVGQVFNLSSEAGGPVDAITQTLDAINGVVDWLQQEASATYNVLATVVDEALTMGTLLGYQYAPTVTINTVSIVSHVTPSPGSRHHPRSGGTDAEQPACHRQLGLGLKFTSRYGPARPAV